MPARERNSPQYLIQIPGWLLLIYLVYAQAIPAFDYELGVRMGTQEPAETITEVGTAFWYGFAFADLVFYIPILLVGLIGHRRNAAWNGVVLGAALGITIYWPIAALASVVVVQGAPGWHLTDLTAYWIVLPAIVLWAAWALWQLLPTRA
ncbi:MAG: hypothetical protein ACR2QR_07025 [Woeseiaceae bacterium]